MAQVTDIKFPKIGNTYSATKQKALEGAIENNAQDVDEVFNALRLGSQGSGLGTGEISGSNVGTVFTGVGTTLGTTVTGIGTLFTSELTVDAEVFVNGEILIVASITNDLEFVSVTPPAQSFENQPYAYRTGIPVNLDYVFTVDTAQAGSAADTFEMPPGTALDGGTTVDWGDGIVNTATSHTYAASGINQIEIIGGFDWGDFNQAGDSQKMLTIDNWGNNVWASMVGAFHGCFSLEIIAVDAPNLVGLTDMTRAFMFCLDFESFPINWGLSNVQTFLSTWEGTGGMLTGFESYDLSSAITLERAWYQYVDRTGPQNWNCTTSVALTSIRETWFRCDLVNCGGTGVSIFPFFEMSNVTDAAAPWVITNLVNLDAGLNFSNVTDIQGFLFGAGFFGTGGEVLPAFDYRKVQNGLAAFQSAPNIVLAAAPQFHALTDGTDMFLNGTATLTQSQYEFVLVDLEANNPNNGVTFNAQGSIYASGSAAETAKNALEARVPPWVFIDGGAVPP